MSSSRSERSSLVFVVFVLLIYVPLTEAVGGGARWTPSPFLSRHHRIGSSQSRQQLWNNQASTQSDIRSSIRKSIIDLNTEADSEPIDPSKTAEVVRSVGRGGQARIGASNFERTVESIVSVLVSVGRTVLPPCVAFTRVVVGFYRTLPIDALLAQAGLVYCFAGGYYPTLFAAVSAAQNCGWETMVAAIDDLAEQTMIAVDAASKRVITKGQSYREIITQKTMIVLATIDPVTINVASAALYSTWLGVSTVLEREFSRTITLSMTIGGYLQPIVRTLFGPPVYLCVPEDYHQWVPVILGWGCKAAAMSVAWRLQRILTATTSAMAGGLMFSRALMRMLSRRGVRLAGVVRENHEETVLDEFLGLSVAAVGLYTQIGDGFSFTVPFPLSLVTWPFDIAENYIQWKITKE